MTRYRHIADDDLDLFPHVGRVHSWDSRAVWDGHTTDAQYERLATAARTRARWVW
ncbi:hypothetical protein AB0J35_62390 [Nonomuraea angiospora]|uniref:hypothetical protein n=1 Tax=Nonomuraea angiospora TaxID=46172 RepID=UPI00343761AE